MDKNVMNIAAYGSGLNSTAGVIGLLQRGVPIELILFADTGGEKPHTYQYLKMFSEWVKRNGHPKGIITVRKAGNGETLEEDCIRREALPSVAYGWKTCSQRFKTQPQDKYLNNYPPAKEVWARGEKIKKFIFFDADEHHRAKDYQDSKYEVSYPLIEWDMGRDECLELIRSVGLPSPGKSACFFCPSSNVSEIRELAELYPDLAKRAIKMEQNANLISVKGLGRDFSWENILTMDDMYDYEPPEIVCGCYDG